MRAAAVPKLTSYTDRVALVTGASSGLGRLLALRFARGGARIALVALPGAELDAVGREIARLGSDGLVLPCDVAERDQVFAAAEQALRHFGRVDLLVNNAGYGHHRPFLEWGLDDMERLFRVNFMGTLYWTKTLLPQMVERGEGWIVFMASVAGRLGVPDESAYAASKFAMVGLAEALASELDDRGVHVLTVCPGPVRTGFFDAEAIARMAPSTRRSMIEPERVVEAIVRALAAGKHEITVPRRLALVYLVRALAPNLLRRNVKRRTVGSLPGVTSGSPSTPR
jgi:short-subunit dehydrogenase